MWLAKPFGRRGGKAARVSDLDRRQRQRDTGQKKLSTI
jgi:hypothetical protein